MQERSKNNIEVAKNRAKLIQKRQQTFLDIEKLLEKN
jgi:hypothetical protein